MKCLNQSCNASDIETDDNFCYKCGHWTSKGYSIVNNKKDVNRILNGSASKKDQSFAFMFLLAALAFITFSVMCIVRGRDFLKPIYVLKKTITSTLTGQDTTAIQLDRIYHQKTISSLDDALFLLKQDLKGQSWKCQNSVEVLKIENALEKRYSIPVVSFCGVFDDEVQKIEEVFNTMYSLFPGIEGALTNVSIIKSSSNLDYIARFQPMFQFVNPSESILEYSKVNRTQILLNGYYFLNDQVLNSPVTDIVGEDWYVKDASFESIIAHEIGHYISFVLLLKQNGLSNIVLETKENEELISHVIDQYGKGVLSQEIVAKSLQNYNEKYSLALTIEEFALSISKYAGSKDSQGNIVYDEILAEAIHDYYLHGNYCAKSSYEIVLVIQSLLGGV